MKYIFGPVSSRRLGKSLGIDPIPLKTCNWNCIYCQLGRTAPMALERSEFCPREELLEEFSQTINSLEPAGIDWITFVGSGEPTLHSSLGWMIDRIKQMTDLPVAVITNGSLLFLPEVRDELCAADAVLPTLDAGNDWLFRRINRPAPRFSFDKQVEGLQKFRQVFSGKLWIEVMLVQGMNDGTAALEQLASILESIMPDQVHITLPLRPPAEAWVRPSSLAEQTRAKEILGRVLPVVIPDSSQTLVARMGDLKETIVSVITRHPMKEEELALLLSRWSYEEIKTALAELLSKKQVQFIHQDEHTFWSAAKSKFPGRQ